MSRIAYLTGAVLFTALLPSSAAAEWRERFKESFGWPPTLTVDHVLVQTSLYTRHFNPDPEHTDQQRLISIEAHTPDRWHVGGARFKNSFNQDSVYVYAGKSFPLWQPNATFELRGKLTAGLLHGYRGEYRDKIPFNHYEIAPAAMPAIGIRWHHVESDLIIFGKAGMMLTAGVRF
ncbi:hypothetical protein [Vreelandella massiliensis]|uniref:hypothetical protein n=1 Tax=Vreelandella massiliensis TaxID=1816686 RepID=UPI00096A3629|nr:hypothetical protein [Halomonas massiliensis]